jgi:hypothetical protein
MKGDTHLYSLSILLLIAGALIVFFEVRELVRTDPYRIFHNYLILSRFLSGLGMLIAGSALLYFACTGNAPEFIHWMHTSEPGEQNQ